MSAAVLLKSHPATLQDLLALPNEGQGYEIIDGELVQKETTGEHSHAQIKLGAKIDPYHRRSGGPPDRPGGWWFGTEPLIDFSPERGPERNYRPDVAGWRREKVPAMPSGTLIKSIPDWICEIISPSNASNDTVKKKRVYHQYHVDHYWLVDPVRETLHVYRWTPDAYAEVLSAERGDRVRAEPFEAVELHVGVFFGDDDE